MKNFKSFLRESLEAELLEHLRGDVFLQESVLDLFSKAVAQVKNADGVPKGVDVTQLATMMTFLSILGNTSHRAAMTKDDIGIDPSNVKDLYDLLNKVKGTGAQEGDVENVVKNVVGLAPSQLHKTEEDLQQLTSDDPTARKAVVDRITAFYTKLQAAMAKMKTIASAGTNAGNPQEKPTTANPDADLAKA
jgi:hypothetical protein